MAAIAFDLDGTLVDSAPDIAAAANRMLFSMGHAPLPLAQLTSFIGHGIPNLVHRVIDACALDPALHPEMNARLVAEYGARPAELTRPYPGVVDMLIRLQAGEYALGLCTNKDLHLTLQILDALDLKRFFDVVIGGDSLSVKKPDPAPLQAAFAGLNGDPLLYVGDSEVDAQTALNSGVAFALFTEGYRQTPVAELRHRFAFSDHGVLPEFVAGFRR